MHERIRQWTVEVLADHIPLLSLAFRQRTKFEQWLKFELALHAEEAGCQDVQVEAALPTGGRCDIALTCEGIRYYVELKTPNANWRMQGIESKSRPITKNFSEIVEDARKLEGCRGQGIVAFVLFPVPDSDRRWEAYIHRVAGNLGIAVSPETDCSFVTVPVGERRSCRAVVCSFACA